MDEASIYDSKSTRAWLAKWRQIVPVSLPSHSPELNLHEKLWRWMRSEVRNNRCFGSSEALVETAERFLAKPDGRRDEVLRHILSLEFAD